jgi:hypothetical protein
VRFVADQKSYTVVRSLPQAFPVSSKSSLLVTLQSVTKLTPAALVKESRLCCTDKDVISDLPGSSTYQHFKGEVYLRWTPQRSAPRKESTSQHASHSVDASTDTCFGGQVHAPIKATMAGSSLIEITQPPRRYNLTLTSPELTSKA